MPKNAQTTVQLHSPHMLAKILQHRLQQYMNRELPDGQSGFRKGRGTRDQTANIHWIIKKARAGADCGSDHEFLIAKLKFKLENIGKTTRPFRYDLNQNPYDYRVE